jgi:surface antigen
MKKFVFVVCLCACFLFSIVNNASAYSNSNSFTISTIPALPFYFTSNNGDPAPVGGTLTGGTINVIAWELYTNQAQYGVPNGVILQLLGYGTTFTQSGDTITEHYVSTVSLYITNNGTFAVWADNLINSSGDYPFSYSTPPFASSLGISYYPSQLTIIIDPETGGNVTGSGIACNTDNTCAICQYSLSQVSSSTLQANANEGYAFGYWKETESSHLLTPSINANKTITAKFFKTFPRNTVTAGYKQSSGYYGACLDYVEYETELPEGVCTYSAVNCLGQAAMKGYATGNTPRAGAIVIYIQGDGVMNNGHIGIVTDPDVGNGNMSIHDSNSNCPNSICDGIVRDRTVSINSTNIMGYIYPTP